MSKRILVLCTSHDRMTDQKRTGLWLEEFVVPVSLFRKAGATITVASPAGGEVPIDARSILGINPQEYSDSVSSLFDTKAIQDIEPNEFDAIFIPGGHGPVFDLASNQHSQMLIQAIANSGGSIGAVCHGPAALVNVVGKDGKPLISKRNVTGFSNAEEEQTGVGPVLPFLLESKLREGGATYSCAQPWQEHVVIDGKLITGQNPRIQRKNSPGSSRFARIARSFE